MSSIVITTEDPISTYEGLPIGRHVLSVVIPTYNSRENIGSTVTRLLAELVKLELDFQILVIDDGSKVGDACDPSVLAQIDNRITVCVLKQNHGQHFSTLLGIKMCVNSEIILTIDDDQSLEAPDIAAAMKLIDQHDLVIMNSSEKQRPRRRAIVSRILAYIVRRVSKQNESFRLSSTRLVSGQLRDRLTRPTGDEYVSVELLQQSQSPTSISLTVARTTDRPSTYTLGGLLRLTGKLLFTYSTYMLRVVTLITLAIALSVSTIPLIYIASTINGVTPPPGWLSTLSIVAGGFALNFLILSILAHYIGVILKFTRVAYSHHHAPIYATIFRGDNCSK